MKKKRTLMVSLDTKDEGSVKIVLDDLIRSDEKTFLKDGLYTFKEYSVSDFENLNFDDKELADFGYSIIARLSAFHKVGEI